MFPTLVISMNADDGAGNTTYTDTFTLKLADGRVCDQVVNVAPRPPIATSPKEPLVRDAPAPAPTLTVAATRRGLAATLRSGLRLRAGCDTACPMAVVARVRGRRAGTAKVTGATVTVRLNRRARKALRGARRPVVVVTVSAPGATSLVHRVTLSRA